jgi:hypothetical protein
MIIGRNFFAHFRISIDVFRRRLIWPREFPPFKTYAKTIAVYSRDDLRERKPSYQYQQDVFRRDRAIAQNDKRRQDGVHIQFLTHDLTQTVLAKKRVRFATETPSESSQVVPEESRHYSRNIPRPLSTPKEPRTRRSKPSALPMTAWSKASPTWERQTRRDLQRMAYELSLPEDY